jgi:hypothetical protein
MNVTLKTVFDTQGHDAPWQNHVAEELNVLLLMAARNPRPKAFTLVVLSLVKRVAEFEEIKVKR